MLETANRLCKDGVSAEHGRQRQKKSKKWGKPHKKKKGRKENKKKEVVGNPATTTGHFSRLPVAGKVGFTPSSPLAFSLRIRRQATLVCSFY